MTEYLSTQEVQSIFSISESILGVHAILDEHLRVARRDRNIGLAATATQTVLPFLKIYALYSSNYVNALETLERARSERPALASAIDRAEAQLANHRQGEGDLRLAACLIRPIKRLCLYPLLLSALLKELEQEAATTGAARGSTQAAEAAETAVPPPPASKATAEQEAIGGGTSAAACTPLETLRAAAEATQQMAMQVNVRVREAESRWRLVELSEQVRGAAPGLLAPHRKLVHEERVSALKVLPAKTPATAPKEATAASTNTPTVSFAVKAESAPAASSFKSRPYTLWLLSDRLLLTCADRSVVRRASAFGGSGGASLRESVFGRSSDLAEQIKVKFDTPLSALRIEWASADASEEAADRGGTPNAQASEMDAAAAATAARPGTGQPQPLSTTFWVQTHAEAPRFAIRLADTARARALFDAIREAQRSHEARARALLARKRTLATPRHAFAKVAGKALSAACGMSRHSSAARDEPATPRLSARRPSLPRQQRSGCSTGLASRNSLSRRQTSFFTAREFDSAYSALTAPSSFMAPTLRTMLFISRLRRGSRERRAFTRCLQSSVIALPTHHLQPPPPLAPSVACWTRAPLTRLARPLRRVLARVGPRRRLKSAATNALPDSVRVSSGLWFGKPLDAQPSCIDRGRRVPALLSALRQAMATSDALSMEGIFRIPADARSQLGVRERLEAGEPPETALLSGGAVDPHTLSGVLKEYLRQLPQGGVWLGDRDGTSALRRALLDQDPNAPGKRQLLQEALPRAHLQMLLWLLDLLGDAAAHSGTSKMGVEGLAVVFAPLLIPWPKEASPLEQLTWAKDSIAILSNLLRGHIAARTV